MRKLIAMVCACAVALGAPSALAGGRLGKYEGDFTGTGSVKFKVEKRQEGKKIVNYRFSDLAVICGGIPKLTSGHLTFAVSVQKNEFSTRAIVGNRSNPKSSLTLKGKLGRGQADGTLRVHGSQVNVGGGERDECDSGKTNWSAIR